MYHSIVLVHFVLTTVPMHVRTARSMKKGLLWSGILNTTPSAYAITAINNTTVQ